MCTLTIRIPDSIHGKVKEIAKVDNISIDQFVTSAIGEKIAVFETETYFIERGKKGSKQKVEEILLKVPDIKLDEWDV